MRQKRQNAWYASWDIDSTLQGYTRNNGLLKLGVLRWAWSGNQGSFRNSAVVVRSELSGLDLESPAAFKNHKCFVDGAFFVSCYQFKSLWQLTMPKSLSSQSLKSINSRQNNPSSSLTKQKQLQLSTIACSGNKHWFNYFKIHLGRTPVTITCPPNFISTLWACGIHAHFSATDAKSSRVNGVKQFYLK